MKRFFCRFWYSSFDGNLVEHEVEAEECKRGGAVPPDRTRGSPVCVKLRMSTLVGGWLGCKGSTQAEHIRRAHGKHSNMSRFRIVKSHLQQRKPPRGATSFVRGWPAGHTTHAPELGAAEEFNWGGAVPLDRTRGSPS